MAAIPSRCNLIIILVINVYLGVNGSDFILKTSDEEGTSCTSTLSVCRLDLGERGAVGPKGDQRINGLLGFSGHPGEKGVKGDVGPTGPVGAEGRLGEKGNNGDIGPTGPAGAEGRPGEKGNKGDMGPTGMVGAEGKPGEKGDKGDMGPTGPAGAEGRSGEKGDKGEMGLTGPVGSEGKPGEKGDKGDIGPTGPAGAEGRPGEKGNKGDMGPTGMVGTEGKQGEKGDKGDMGPTGPAGAEGRSGEKGNKGDMGPTGMVGAEGKQGEKGDKGDMGPTGLVGAEGRPGEKGDQGDMGPAGALGPSGPVGERGPPGRAGTPGICNCIPDSEDDHYGDKTGTEPDKPDSKICGLSGHSNIPPPWYIGTKLKGIIIEVECNEYGATCIKKSLKFPVNYTKKVKPFWLSEHNDFMIKDIYDLTRSQVIWLQERSTSVNQTIRYHCKNSRPYNEKDVDTSLVLLTFNDLTIGPVASQTLPFYYSVLNDKCSGAKKDEWSYTDIVIQTDVVQRLPIVDFFIRDIRKEDQEFRLENIEICFG